MASAVAGNGEQRAVSPRALSRSSCLGPEGETSETDERHVYRVPCRFSLDPPSVRKEDRRRDFLSGRESPQIRTRSYLGSQPR